jgi:hypothetical protein
MPSAPIHAAARKLLSIAVNATWRKAMKPFVILALAALPLLAALPAQADINPDGNGGANCKNTTKHPGSCTLLEATCAGKYTDATDPQGHVYGKCSKVLKSGLKLKAN